MLLLLLTGLGVAAWHYWDELTSPRWLPYLPELGEEQIRRLQDAAADTAGLPVIFRDRLDDGSPAPEMVVIPAGEFTMGSPHGEEGREEYEEPHRVRIERSFALGRYEVSFEEYERFVVATGHRRPQDQNWGRHRQPVIDVSWHDATAYTEWLSRETRQRYRLPTEAEWEYAARAGSRTARYWGDDPSMACRYANVFDRTARRKHDLGWKPHSCSDGFTETAPVGRFKPNGFGLYDMLGNVWEWTCSGYEEAYGAQTQQCLSDTGIRRAIRGGSWGSKQRGVRAAFRGRLMPGGRYRYGGFRLAREL